MYKTYLSAKTRTELSKPAREAIAHFEPGCKILDYGCGKGSDVEHWNNLGYHATGYDPNWFPQMPEPGEQFDVVTNFYVLNVIDKVRDRIEMLQSAWEYTQDKLIVAAVIGVEVRVSDTYFAEFLSSQVRRMIIFATRRWPELITQGTYFVSRKWAEVSLYDYYSAEDAIAEIRQKPVARDGEYISEDRGRYLYHANGTRKTIDPEKLPEWRSRIDRREKIRAINLCTF
jgi:SAM-dependent methyltransferase